MEFHNHRLLVVDDEEDVRGFCVEALTDAGFTVEEAASGKAALEVLERGLTDIVLTDFMMPGMNGLELLKAIKRDHPGVDVVMMTGYGSIQNAVEAMRCGAYDYLTKPLCLDDLILFFERLTDHRELAEENAVLRAQVRQEEGFGGLVGSSSRIQQTYRLILKFAERPNPVLVLGETGTGKELVARAIHEQSSRRREPFVPVDCGSLSANLIESELFGYVRGAFTDARQDRAGLLAAAGAGTVFLDEIGELPLNLQATLLRALQEKEFRPLGGNRFVPLQARIVAATNRDLQAEVKAGRFREDLFYRLNVLVVQLPPLREHKSDLPALVQAFLKRHSNPGDPVEGISHEAMQLLLAYDWPGNVRELENFIQRSIAISAGPLIDPADLPEQVRAARTEALPAKFTYLQEMERKAITEMLEASGGHRVRAAQLLGMSKTSLYRKLKEYGLEEACLPAEQ